MEPARLPRDEPPELPHPLGGEGAFLEELPEHADRGHRRLQLMGDICQQSHPQGREAALSIDGESGGEHGDPDDGEDPHEEESQAGRPSIDALEEGGEGRSGPSPSRG